MEKQLAAACEDTQVLIALRTATEGGDRGSIFSMHPSTSLSLLTSSIAETKRKKRKLDDDSNPSPAYSRTKMARSNSAAPNSSVPSNYKNDRDVVDRGSGASSVPSAIGTNPDLDLPRSGRNGKKGSSADGPGTSGIGDESLLTLKSEVAYRLPKQKGVHEGEWIQCIIIDINGEGGKRRYVIQDPEPDETNGHAQVYKAAASALIPIPRDSAGLQPYPVGKQVFAIYPETTMFYRAEVTGTKVEYTTPCLWDNSAELMQRDGTCRLKFEGEDEVDKETEVERRLVLDVGGR